MADFASNTPISRPVQLNWTADFDIGGMCWNYQWGMFYQSTSNNDLLPFRMPAPITGQQR